MASIQWMKQTMQKAGSLIKHNGHEERKHYDHANSDIDKSRSTENFFIGCKDYKDAFDQMKKRVAMVDKQYPPLRIKKDRIVCCSLYTPCPQAIETKGTEAIHTFFEATYALLQGFFGEENVHGMTVHGDERHEYIDSRTGKERTSLYHGTTLVSAYCEWTEKQKDETIQRKGINGKHFETKSKLKSLNTAMCEMVRSKFGIEYNTGELVKSETAEVLKVKSKLVAVKKELNGHEEAVQRAKQQEAASLAQLQENSGIIAQQTEQINVNNDILLQQNQYIKKVSEDKPDASEVNTADRKAVREYNKKVERWNKNVEGKYNGSIFDKNKENRELTLVSNAQKKSTVSLEQRESTIKQREKQCLTREKNIDLEIQKRLEAELKRAALYKRLMQINVEWETRYAEIYSRTKSHARYLTELAQEQTQETELERTDIIGDKHTEEKQNNHCRTNPETFDGR